MPRVLNKRTATEAELAGAIYVGRPTMFGNPYRVSKDCSLAMAIVKYQHWLVAHPAIVDAAIKCLRGRDLVCWCAPKPCHADILLKLVNAPE